MKPGPEQTPGRRRAGTWTARFRTWGAGSSAMRPLLQRGGGQVQLQWVQAKDCLHVLMVVIILLVGHSHPGVAGFRCGWIQRLRHHH